MPVNMIHPSEILRSESEERHFSAPSNAVPRRPIDCGLAAIPCLNRCNIEKCAKPGVFLCSISLLGLFQGAVFTYFRGTANSWMQHYNFSPNTVDWLLYFNDIFIGMLAFVVGYWGNRIHRASWLGGLAIFQAIACFVLIVPETHRQTYFSNFTTEIALCQSVQPSQNNLGQPETNYIALVSLYVYQFFYAMTMVSLITHGLTYLDDNVNKKNSASYLCVALASFQVGKQVGMYLTWITITQFLPYVFLTPMWLIFGILIFILGVAITMFPSELPSVVMRKMVESLLVLAHGEEEEELDRYSEEFWTTFLRLLKNKVLMFNVYASLFMHGAVINFDLLQTKYYQSRFFVYVSLDKSGYQDSWLAQILTNLMKQPFVALSIVTTGMVIAKVRPSARKVAVFNVSIATVALVLYAIYGFLQCDAEIKSEFQNQLSNSYCYSDCACSDVVFSPVCTTDGQNTYFSPCHAGCSKMNDILGIFEDCSCGQNLNMKSNTTARSGSCNSDSCTFLWGLAQVNGITIAALIASTTITNLLINLRCVYKTDKAMSMALEATLVGILPYVPLRLIYAAFEDYFCIFNNKDGTCKLHSKHLGTFVTTMTVGLMGIAVGLYVVVVFLVKDLNLYEEAKTGSSRLSPLPPMGGSHREAEDDDGSERPKETDVILHPYREELDFRTKTVLESSF